jgi:hypothetical protein
VDGAVVDWSDTFNGPLEPGESETLQADNGPKGTAYWKAVIGSHVIIAHVDDVGRINESNVSNNTLEKRIIITP